MKPLAVALMTSLFVSLSSQVEAQGNLVVNGGFDGNANGWTLANGASYAGGNVLLDNIDPATSTDPTASQTIDSLTPGSVYVVSGDYQRSKDRGGGGSSTDLAFGVALDGVFLFQGFATNLTNLDWYRFSFPYTATASSTVLSLSSQINGTGISYGIDNISVRAVPEPSSLWLMGVVAIVSAIFLRNRKKVR